MKDNILSYREMCNRLGLNTIQRGMNYRIKGDFTVILMSVRKNAPYADQIDPDKNLLIYEGHDVPKSDKVLDPKVFDQPLWTEKGSLTQNGLFVQAAEAFKRGLRAPEKVLVFEKLDSGVWSEKGFFNLIDYNIAYSNGRKVFKFILKPVENIEAVPLVAEPPEEYEHNRLIPTDVKVKVWKRDKGRCVLYGSKENLHYDHELPYSKGGSSITEKNIRILCAKCNLKKSDKIE